MKTTKEKILAIQDEAKKIIASNKDFAWLVGVHLEKVKGNAEWLLERLPEADRDVVMLGVWLHDVIYFIDFSKQDKHAELGADLAMEMMRKVDMPEDIVDKVDDMIRNHSCKGTMPRFLEGKILATADAMSHFSPDFFLSLAIYDHSWVVSKFKKFALDKLERDFNGNKIFFDFAKEKVTENYHKLKAFFEME